jgi:hypothetical protein
MKTISGRGVRHRDNRRRMVGEPRAADQGPATVYS